MNPIVFHCVLLFVLVVLLSVFQSRFKIVTDSPVIFVLMVIVVPVLVFLKVASKRHDFTWIELTGVEIAIYTLVWAFINAKFFVPRINEGYILAYTLFHWYLIGDTILLKGLNNWMIVAIAISIIPSIVVLKACFEHKKLGRTEKLIIYYWFLFTVIFTYADQVALHIITPIITQNSIGFRSITYVCFTAVQLYFISTILSLLFVGIPLFHMDRNTRWHQAVKECNEIRKHKLDNYIEYQISIAMTLFIIFLSGILFFLDYKFKIRQYLIAVYTLVFPMVFFYLKWTPGVKNRNTY